MNSPTTPPNGISLKITIVWNDRGEYACAADGDAAELVRRLSSHNNVRTTVIGVLLPALATLEVGMVVPLSDDDQGSEIDLLPVRVGRLP